MGEALANNLEHYGHSLRAIRTLGRAALDGQTRPDQAEIAAGEAAESRADFITAVSEMLATDPELAERLEVDTMRHYAVRNGRARNASGMPIVQVVARGLATSTKRALVEPAFEHQALLDRHNLAIAEWADRLPAGSTLFALSMEPREAMARHPELYKDELGYRPGLVYWQFYSRVSQDELVAGSFSVMGSDRQIWSEVLAEQGQVAPVNHKSCDWLISSAHERLASAETAANFVRQLRRRYYQKVGQPCERLSVNGYVRTQSHQLEAMFRAYYPALGRAVNSRLNQPVLQAFAQRVLAGDVARLDPDIRRRLTKLANSRQFDDEDGRLLDSLLRYAAAERLRLGLRRPEIKPTSTGRSSGVFYAQARPPRNQLDLNTLVAADLLAGVAAGRSYGGCPGGIKPGLDQIAPGALQTAYGGRAEIASGGQESTSGIIRCIQCRQMVLKAAVVKPKDGCWECPKCLHRVDVCTGAVLKRGNLRRSRPLGPSGPPFLRPKLTVLRSGEVR